MGEIQAPIHTMGRELVVEMMARADTKAPVVPGNGVQWGKGRETTGDYRTVFGTGAVDRATYKKAGPMRASQRATSNATVQ